MKKKFTTALAFLFFISTVNGAWQNVGPLFANITCLLLNNGVYYAGTDGGGIAISTDGNRFTGNTTGLNVNSRVTSLAAFGNTVFAGTAYYKGPQLYPTTGTGYVYASTDNGATWNKASAGLPSGADVNSLATSSDHLFAATTTGIYVSADTGKTWTLANNGITSAVNALSGTGNTIYAATNNGAYSSTDNGGSWQAIGNIGKPLTCLIAADTFLMAGTVDDLVYAKTPHSGWSKYGYSLVATKIYNLAVAYEDNFWTVFACTDVGIYQLRLPGNVWEGNGSGLTHDKISSVIPVSSSQIYAGVFNEVTDPYHANGISISNDYGYDWGSYYNISVNNADVTSFCVTGSTIYAALYGNGLFRFDKNGTYWNYTALSNTNIYSMAADGLNLIVTNKSFESDVYVSNTGANDGKQVYTFEQAPVISTVAIDGSKMYITPYGEGVLYSADNGDTWNDLNNGINTSDSISSFAANGNQLFAGGKGFVYVSNNSGTGWLKHNSGLPNSAVISLAITDSVIYAGTAGNGVYQSTNTGQSWSPVGVNGNDYIMQMALRGDTIYAAGYNRGLLVGVAPDYEWQEINYGWSSNYVTAVAFVDSSLYVGTFGSGIWSNAADLPTGTQQLQPSQGFTMYPNPTGGKFILHTATDGWLQVYNTAGQHVLTQPVNAGSTTIDVNQLPVGVYTVMLKTNDGVATRKLVVAK